jgi:hypothetical protein
MPLLTIGMPTYNDFDGVYFTIQALRMNCDVSRCEFLVIDNFGCLETENFISKWVPNGRYIKNTIIQGTAHAKNLVFEHSQCDYVLCLDCHVLLLKGSLDSLFNYYRGNPHTQDLIQGPLYYDDLVNISTHMNPEWRGQMLGTWAYDGRVKSEQVFNIPLHGMGLFSCRKSAWLGFHPQFRGFGGEEGYIHEKFRQAGRHCLCLSALGWVHRFGRPRGVPYRLSLEDKVKNYFIGHLELNLDLTPIYDHFKTFAKIEALNQWEQQCRNLIDGSASRLSEAG